MNQNIIGANNAQDAMYQIIRVLQKEMQDPTNTPEENAFYLGNINLATAMFEAFSLEKNGLTIGRVCFDYNKVKKSYEQVFGEPKFEKVGNTPRFHDIKQHTPTNSDLAKALLDELERRLKDASEE